MLSIIRNNKIKQIAAIALNVNIRALATSSIRNGSFKVQDDKEFLEKVENSKEPVIVDFFAT